MCRGRTHHEVALVLGAERQSSCLVLVFSATDDMIGSRSDFLPQRSLQHCLGGRMGWRDGVQGLRGGRQPMSHLASGKSGARRETRACSLKEGPPLAMPTDRALVRLLVRLLVMVQPHRARSRRKHQSHVAPSCEVPSGLVEPTSLRCECLRMTCISQGWPFLGGVRYGCLWETLGSLNSFLLILVAMLFRLTRTAVPWLPLTLGYTKSWVLLASREPLFDGPCSVALVER